MIPAYRRRPGRLPRIGAAVAAGALILSLAGCGTVSKSECQAGDWVSIGLRDGRNGEPPAFFERNAESCARFGLPADRESWLRGREEGLREYCTPRSGFAAGTAGRTYHGVCEGRRGVDFLDAYGFGRDVHVAREAARGARAESDRIERRIGEIEDEILAIRAELSVSEGDGRERLRRRLADLEDLRFELVSDRFAAEREARIAERAADAAEARARDDFFRRFGASPV